MKGTSKAVTVGYGMYVISFENFGTLNFEKEHGLKLERLQLGHCFKLFNIFNLLRN